MRKTLTCILMMMALAAASATAASLLSNSAWTFAGEEWIFPVFNEQGLPELIFLYPSQQDIRIWRRVYQTIREDEISYKEPDYYGNLTSESLVKTINAHISIEHHYVHSGSWINLDKTYYRNRISDTVEYIVKAYYEDSYDKFPTFYMFESRQSKDGVTSIFKISFASRTPSGSERDTSTCRDIIQAGITSMKLTPIDKRFSAEYYKSVRNGMYSKNDFYIDQLYSALLLNTDQEVIHDNFGYTLEESPIPNLPISINPFFATSAAPKKYDPQFLIQELAEAKATVQLLLDTKNISIVRGPQELILNFMDEEYTDLLRRLFFDLGNYYYTTDLELALTYFRLAVFFSLKIEHRLVLDFTQRYCAGFARGGSLTPVKNLFKPNLPPRLNCYMTYNIACLCSLLESPDAAVQWLILARCLGFPNFASYSAKDPDLKNTWAKYPDKLKNIGTIDPDKNPKAFSEMVVKYLE